MALQELKVNKLRTFLSLFGITIGIFCIIGVLATVNSMESKVQGDLNALGTNSIYIDKWEYLNDPNYPWWKYINRPVPRYEEAVLLRERSRLAQYIAFSGTQNAKVLYRNNEIQSTIYGVTEDYVNIQQSVEVDLGRYISPAEFRSGSAVCVMGYADAEQLFGEAEKALGQVISFNSKKATVIGVIRKQGKSFLGGNDYDYALVTPYRFFASVYDMSDSDPVIMVNSAENIPSSALSDELKGIMRQIRRLSPKQEDNFSLNDISNFSESISGFFGTVNAGGWAIAGLSLVVGAFGVANIMFVTVKERTSQIGLKKAIGAKSSLILTEFLLESAFLCLMGGIIGLGLVWLLTLALNQMMPFAITISPGIIVLAFSICIVLGVLSGIIPARSAARMNPVVAIRSK